MSLGRDRLAGFGKHCQPLFGEEKRRLAGMGSDRQHQPVGEPHGLAHDIEMAVGDGIEGARKERNTRHDAV